MLVMISKEDQSTEQEPDILFILISGLHTFAQSALLSAFIMLIISWRACHFLRLCFFSPLTSLILHYPHFAL